MSIPKDTFSKLIKEFKLKELFNELGWDNVTVKYPIAVDGRMFHLAGIAQKKEFLILLCLPEDGAGIPDNSARKKIDNQIAKFHYEHLIIYVDAKKTRQRWELMIREENKPLVSRPIEYYAGQEPEALFQKLEGLFFSYEDEEKLSIVDVRSRVMENFDKNAEIVTKKFYERFEKEHEKFLDFINGIRIQVDQEWYASLMLNRLMFIYFIQKKGFLDNDRHYLRNRLKIVQQKKGKDKFYSFYRNFLLVLFHKGLGSPQRDRELEVEIGKVPYLNGGLFDVHKLEHENEEISIEDKAFERIFDFFDEYNWHLDTRITATGKDINPDVIGYIFEKYINDRAAMGAYYTKEDITEYISKNCIVPWLFDEVKRSYPEPFRKDGEVWSRLSQNGDRYIYPAIKYGLGPDATAVNGFADLPEDVRSCVDANMPGLIEKQKSWSRPAPAKIALPTENYREVVSRRKRYFEVRKKIETGRIAEINDFITYNLNIRQFAQDVLEKTDDPKLIMEFYKAIKKITVLDPTCGSGAFLFAALNVLEPLYLALVTRMREFEEEHGGGKHKFFEDERKLIDSNDHPNEEYFIYKSIILHNLYGVDIMKEAVEITKLRLFLKLVATVDVDYKKPNLGLEPLPDIDFNIRSGNTLVGYATLADLDKAGQGGLFGNEEKQAILEEADVVSRAYARFKDAQLVMHSEPKTYKVAKDELNKRLTVLNDKLGKYLAVMYLGSVPSDKGYGNWIRSHQPFHWLAEFYTTIARGGFDVIIGNPPYVSSSKVRGEYNVIGYATEACPDIYAWVLERATVLQSRNGRSGFIVPLSLGFSRDFDSCRRILTKAYGLNWYSSFGRIPSALFSFDVRVRNTIHLGQKTESKTVCYTTRLFRWFDEERPNLFPLLSYEGFSPLAWSNKIPKIDKPGLLQSLESRLNVDQRGLKAIFSPRVSKYPLFFKKTAYNWLNFCKVLPPCYDESGKLIPHTQFDSVYFDDSQTRDVAFLFLNGKLCFTFWAVVGDDFHVAKWMFADFPLCLTSLPINLVNELLPLATRLEQAMEKATTFKLNAGKKVGNYNLARCRGVTDLSDHIFAKHLGCLDLWEEVELFYGNLVRTDFDDKED